MYIVEIKDQKILLSLLERNPYLIHMYPSQYFVGDGDMLNYYFDLKNFDMIINILNRISANPNDQICKLLERESKYDHKKTKIYEFIKRIVKEESFDTNAITKSLYKYSPNWTLFDVCLNFLKISRSIFLEDLSEYDCGLSGPIDASYYFRTQHRDTNNYVIKNSKISFSESIKQCGNHEIFNVCEIQINNQWNDCMKILNSDLIKIIFSYSAFMYNNNITIKK